MRGCQSRLISAWAGDGEQRFASPQEATNALVAAAKAKDTNALQSIFGPEGRDLVSPDAVQAGNSFSNFVRRLTRKVDLVPRSDSNIVLEIGADAWPFPIPLAQQGGQWFFDTAAGKEEILNRRIGVDELAAIRVCQSYVDAQREYASQPRNGDDVLEYAQRLRSTTNTHDGLYWHTEPGEELSPLGPLIAQSREEGYQPCDQDHGGKPGPVPGLLFQDSDAARFSCACRQIQIHHQWPLAGWIRPGGLAGGMGQFRSDDFHGQPGGQSLSKKPRGKNRHPRRRDGHLRSRSNLEASLGGRPVKRKSKNPSMKNPIGNLVEAPKMYATDTADLFTEISRGTDKWLWFVEAHSQAPK